LGQRGGRGVSLLAGENVLTRECVRKTQSRLREELMGDDPSATELMLVDLNLVGRPIGPLLSRPSVASVESAQRRLSRATRTLSAATSTAQRAVRRRVAPPVRCRERSRSPKPYGVSRAVWLDYASKREPVFIQAYLWPFGELEFLGWEEPGKVLGTKVIDDA